METFIALRIMKEADKSLEAGQAKYEAYFINLSLYRSYQANVDGILRTDGYGEVIPVAE